MDQLMRASQHAEEATPMTCFRCRGDMLPGTKTATLERAGTLLVLRGIPGEVCEQCGEAAFTADVSDRMKQLWDDAVRGRYSLAIRDYQTP